MKILITGSDGFLGKSVSDIIKKKLKKNNFFFITRKKHKKKNYLFLDLNNTKKFLKLLNEINPDVIINLAAEANFSTISIMQKKKMLKINTLIPKICANFCKLKGKYLIQTSAIITEAKNCYFSARQKKIPKNFYLKTKFIADNYIKKSRCKYTIIKFGGIYGKNGPTHLGLNKFIKKALNNKKIIFKGNPKSKRNYIFVKDAAKLILKFVKKPRKGVFAPAGNILTFNYMLKKISKILGEDNKILFKKTQEDNYDQIIKKNIFFKNTSFTKSLEIIKNN